MRQIKVMRELREVTQQELARQIGVSQAQMSNIESGYTEPTPEQIAAIKVALDWPDNADEAFAMLEVQG